ncbi:MAG: FHA domain-containing protein [Planctomycetes bacterium]|nr:FHA domain-containing protein [Planctomycetota bacterium]
MASIIITSGPAEGRYYTLSQKSSVIGRDERCTIQIVDELISGQHLEIRCEEGERTYHAVDMHSTNGVRVNDQPVTAPTRLLDRDVIDIGNSQLVFSIQEFPDRESAFSRLKLPGERFKSTVIE